MPKTHQNDPTAEAAGANDPVKGGPVADETAAVLADATVSELEAAVAFRRAEALKAASLDDLNAALARRQS